MNVPLPRLCIVHRTDQGVSCERSHGDGVVRELDQVRGKTSVNHPLTPDICREADRKTPG